MHTYNHHANRLLRNFFSIFLLNGRSRDHNLCPLNFQKNSNFAKTNVVPPCGTVQTSFEICIKIDLQMVTW